MWEKGFQLPGLKVDPFGSMPCGYRMECLEPMDVKRAFVLQKILSSFKIGCVFLVLCLHGCGCCSALLGPRNSNSKNHTDNSMGIPASALGGAQSVSKLYGCFICPAYWGLGVRHPLLEGLGLDVLCPLLGPRKQTRPGSIFFS